MTSISQDDDITGADTTITGDITYTKEDGTTTTVDVVSSNGNTKNPDNGAVQSNSISVGSDGGAYFASPMSRAVYTLTEPLIIIIYNS